MTIALPGLYAVVANWSNENQGVISVALFVITIAYGWASGIFSALRRRPRFKISLIDGPTFSCTYPIGKKHGEYEVHRTGIALYLQVANIGSAASSIERVSVGYHWHLRRASIALWLKYRIGWFWLTTQAASLTDFQVSIGGNIKVYPFLTQKNFLSPVKSDTYLDVGRSTNGVVYFEQQDSWGGCFPTVSNNEVRIKIRVDDVFGNCHTKTFRIPSVSLDYARKYNPSFGKTQSELNGEELPFDKTK